MPVRRIYANPKVRADAGCVAFMRGPVVYCFEQADQKEPLQTYRIPEWANVKEYFCREGVLDGMMLLKIEGHHLKAQDKLYSQERAQKEDVWMTAIPYFAWGNREEGDMRVWMVE